MKAPTAPSRLNLRQPPELRAALEKAAKDDRRSVTDLARIIISDWLRERGYLKDNER